MKLINGKKPSERIEKKLENLRYYPKDAEKLVDQILIIVRDLEQEIAELEKKAGKQQ